MYGLRLFVCGLQRLCRLQLVGLRVVKELLLHDSGGAAVPGERVLSMICLADDFLNPGVNRSAGSPAIGKQRHTAGHFDSHTPHPLQSGNQFTVGKGGDSGEIQSSRKNLVYRIAEVRGPVSGLAGQVILQAGIFQLQSRWKGIERFLRGPYFAAVPLAEELHHGTDGRDAFALGDDEGDQCFPGVLAQNADTGADLGGLRQEGVLRRDGVADVPVIAVQIEVWPPDYASKCPDRSLPNRFPVRFFVCTAPAFL